MFEVARSVPRVWLEEDQLVWDPSDRKPPRKGRILDQFCNLGDAKPGRFLIFARNYGVLGLCPHGFPAGWCSTDVCRGWKGEQIRKGWNEQDPPLDSNYAMRESVEIWGHFVRQVAAIRRAGRAIQWPDAYRLTDEDKAALSYGGSKFRGKAETLRRVEVAVLVLLEMTRVHPRFKYERGEPRLTLWSSVRFNLLATVTMELVYDLMAPSAMDSPPVTCHSCHDEFVPARRPRSDGSQRSWCPKPVCKAARGAYHARRSRARTQDQEVEAIRRREK